MNLVAGANQALPVGPVAVDVTGPFDLSAVVLDEAGRVAGVIGAAEDLDRRADVDHVVGQHATVVEERHLEHVGEVDVGVDQGRCRAGSPAHAPVDPAGTPDAGSK